MKVRLSGGAGRARFVFKNRIMSKATIAKILEAYGVEVVENCKDCAFIVVPDNVEQPSNSAKHATHNTGMTMKISKFIEMLVEQKNRNIARIETKKANKKNKSTKSVKNPKPKPKPKHSTKRAAVSKPTYILKNIA